MNPHGANSHGCGIEKSSGYLRPSLCICLYLGFAEEPCPLLLMTNECIQQTLWNVSIMGRIAVALNYRSWQVPGRRSGRQFKLRKTVAEPHPTAWAPRFAHILCFSPTYFSALLWSSSSSKRISVLNTCWWFLNSWENQSTEVSCLGEKSEPSNAQER